jgi:hypothetical protein
LLQVDCGELGHAVVHIKEALLKVFTVRLSYTKAKLKDGAEYLCTISAADIVHSYLQFDNNTV